MLFFKECRKLLFSLTFLLYTAALLAFYITQFSADCSEPVEKPMPGGDYGFVAKEIPEILMPAAAKGLLDEYLSNTYTAYPIGFYKEVKLGEKKRARMAAILTEITGAEVNGYTSPAPPEIPLSDTLTYGRFRELMRAADKLIGGGSKYSDESLVENFSLIPRTYEEALAEYQQITEGDGLAESYGRLFCDYLGIIVSILPVFVAAAFVNADRKSHMEELLYSRAVSSVKLTGTRYLSLVAMLFVPIVILSFHVDLKLISLYPQAAIDLTAVPGLAVIWLLPNVMFSSALGMLLTEFLSPLPAVFLQGVWWIASILGTASGLTGKIRRFTLVCRHNSLYEADRFKASFANFIFNRIFYAVLSLVLLSALSFLYNLKRKGVFRDCFKNHNRKSKA